MSLINPSRCYFAVNNTHRQAFANCFSGNLSEASIRLKDANGAIWWGANGSYDLIGQLDRSCLAASQLWYCVIVFQVANVAAPGGIVFDTNLPFVAGQPDPGFDAFLAACNLERWPETGDNGNISLFGGGGNSNGTLQV